MKKPNRVRSVSLCYCLLLLVLFTACSKKPAAQNVLDVSFRKDSNEQGPSFSSSFQFTSFNSFPAAVGSNNTYLYSRLMTCLDGKAVVAEGEAEPAKLYLCFTIHVPPSPTQDKRIHAGTFPVFTQVIPTSDGEAGVYALNEVSELGLELTEYGIRMQSTENEVVSRELRERKVVLVNKAAQGSIEITVSEKDRLTGKINVQDKNLSITGVFDCPHRFR